jgi:hypothetical protein
MLLLGSALSSIRYMRSSCWISLSAGKAEDVLERRTGHAESLCRGRARPLMRREG